MSNSQNGSGAKPKPQQVPQYTPPPTTKIVTESYDKPLPSGIRNQPK